MSDARRSEPPPNPAPEAGAPSGQVQGSDVVVLGRPTPDGEGLGVVRIRDGQAEAGALRPLQHGKPIRGEVVTLHPRKDQPGICDVEVEVDAKPPRPASSRNGPPQVATDRYRENWDAIWASKPASGEPN